MGPKSAFGKNNFDRLEAAGLVAGEDVTAEIKAKTQTRITELTALVGKMGKVEAALQDLYVLAKPQRLKKLTQVLNAVKKLHATSLPVGSKKHVERCVNEITSLREGIYADAKVDKKAMALIATIQAKADILALAGVAKSRYDKILADSGSTFDTDELDKKVAEIIEKHSHDSGKVSDIKTSPFVIARLPVVPADSVSVDRLTRLGFDVDNLSGYPVLKNQLVFGINPKFLLGENSAAMNGVKAAAFIREEADRLRKKFQKTTKRNLQFVSDKSFSYGSGTWFWLMTDRELDMFAKAFPGSHVKVTRWGFAFN